MCNALNEDIEQLRQQVSNLEKENCCLNDVITEHEERQSALKQELNNCKNKLQQLEKDSDTRNEQCLMLQAGLHDISNRLEEVTNKRRKVYKVNEYYETEFESVRDRFVVVMSRYMRSLIAPVSYTHLDVYKRQLVSITRAYAQTQADL